MDAYDIPGADSDADPLEAAEQAFSGQLMACLDECARGRKGLFSDIEDETGGWPEAARLRELALAMQSAFRQMGRTNALAEEFLDLCSIHGETHPGERKLARTFLERIERGEVGVGGEGGRKPWG